MSTTRPLITDRARPAVCPSRKLALKIANSIANPHELLNKSKDKLPLAFQKQSQFWRRTRGYDLSPSSSALAFFTATITRATAICAVFPRSGSGGGKRASAKKPLGVAARIHSGDLNGVDRTDRPSAKVKLLLGRLYALWMFARHQPVHREGHFIGMHGTPHRDSLQL